MSFLENCFTNTQQVAIIVIAAIVLGAICGKLLLDNII